MLSIRRFLLHRICVQHLIKPDFFVFEKGNFLYKPSLFQSSDSRGKSPNLAIAILQHASILSLGYVSDWNHLPKKEKRWLLLSKALLAYTNGFQQACSFKVLRQDVAGLCAETCSLSCYLEEGECGASYLVPYCWSFFLQVCENYPLSSRAFRNGNLKVRSYYEQKGTLRMRKSEKKVSWYIKRA